MGRGIESLFPTPERLKLLEAVNEHERVWSSCRECELCEGRTRVVGHRGHPARIMLVGEAPGEREDREGRPFVGSSGKLLDELLHRAGMETTHVFMTNVVACRPPLNREPEREEMRACFRRIEGLVAIIRPRVLLLVGRVSANKLAGVQSITASRGQVMESIILDEEAGKLIPCVPTFHPSFLLRANDGAERRRLEENVVDDFRTAKAVAAGE